MIENTHAKKAFFTQSHEHEGGKRKKKKSSQNDSAVNSQCLQVPSVDVLVVAALCRRGFCHRTALIKMKHDSTSARRLPRVLGPELGRPIFPVLFPGKPGGSDLSRQFITYSFCLSRPPPVTKTKFRWEDFRPKHPSRGDEPLGWYSII